jgi:hypothetical protein
MTSRMPMIRRPLRVLSLALLPSLAEAAADGSPSPGTLAWIVIGAIALFIVGVVIRMIISARFPRDFRAWTRERRDEFAARNEHWDRADDEFRR